MLLLITITPRKSNKWVPRSHLKIYLFYSLTLQLDQFGSPPQNLLFLCHQSVCLQPNCHSIQHYSIQIKLIQFKINTLNPMIHKYMNCISPNLLSWFQAKMCTNMWIYSRITCNWLWYFLSLQVVNAINALKEKERPSVFVSSSALGFYGKGVKTQV